MANYTAFWDCLGCGARQESLDRPNRRDQFCQSCIERTRSHILETELRSIGYPDDVAKNLIRHLEQAHSLEPGWMRAHIEAGKLMTSYGIPTPRFSKEFSKKSY